MSGAVFWATGIRAGNPCLCSERKHDKHTSQYLPNISYSQGTYMYSLTGSSSEPCTWLIVKFALVTWTPEPGFQTMEFDDGSNCLIPEPRHMSIEIWKPPLQLRWSGECYSLFMGYLLGSNPIMGTFLRFA